MTAARFFTRLKSAAIWALAMLVAAVHALGAWLWRAAR